MNLVSKKPSILHSMGENKHTWGDDTELNEEKKMFRIRKLKT